MNVTLPTVRNPSPTEISARIAYAGRIGRERKKWCEDFIAWKTGQLKEMETSQAQHALSIGKRISCSKGCCYCCSQYVGASLQECEAIVYWLHLHSDVREAFLARYKTWRSRLRTHEAVFQELNQAARESLSLGYDLLACEIFMQKSEQYGQLNILCPFLDDNICSIYPMRPFSCAGYVVVSPPDHCKPSREEAPLPLHDSTSPIQQPSYFRGPADNVIFSPAPLLVYEIIHGGFMFLNDLPGLAGLEDEAFADPEIRALLR